MAFYDSDLKPFKRKSIPIQEVKEIIEACPNRLTRALIAFQFALGCRIGELAEIYRRKLKRENKQVEEVIQGIQLKDIQVTPTLLTIRRPNLKKKTLERKETIFLRNGKEKWLVDVLLDWISSFNGLPISTPLFSLRVSRMRSLVDACLKKKDSSYSTHCLRHGRAKQLREEQGFDMLDLKEFLGHSNINVTARYGRATPFELAEKIAGTKEKKLIQEKQ